MRSAYSCPPRDRGQQYALRNTQYAPRMNNHDRRADSHHQSHQNLRLRRGVRAGAGRGEPERAAGRVAGRHGAERLRQEHAAQHARRARPAHLRRGVGGGRESGAAQERGRFSGQDGRLRLPAPQSAADPQRAGERRGADAGATAGREAAGTRQEAAGDGRADRAGQCTCPASSPAASGSEWRSPARWRTARR